MPGEITVGAQGKHVQQYGVAAHETFINKLVFIATVCVGSLLCTVMLSSVGTDVAEVHTAGCHSRMAFGTPYQHTSQAI